MILPLHLDVARSCLQLSLAALLLRTARMGCFVVKDPSSTTAKARCRDEEVLEDQVGQLTENDKKSKQKYHIHRADERGPDAASFANDRRPS